MKTTSTLAIALATTLAITTPAHATHWACVTPTFCVDSETLFVQGSHIGGRAISDRMGELVFVADCEAGIFHFAFADDDDTLSMPFDTGRRNVGGLLCTQVRR